MTTTTLIPPHAYHQAGEESKVNGHHYSVSITGGSHETDKVISGRRSRMRSSSMKRRRRRRREY